MPIKYLIKEIKIAIDFITDECEEKCKSQASNENKIRLIQANQLKQLYMELLLKIKSILSNNDVLEKSKMEKDLQNMLNIANSSQIDESQKIVLLKQAMEKNLYARQTVFNEDETSAKKMAKLKQKNSVVNEFKTIKKQHDMEKNKNVVEQQNSKVSNEDAVEGAFLEQRIKRIKNSKRTKTGQIDYESDSSSVKYVMENDCYYLNNKKVNIKPKKLFTEKQKAKYILSKIGGENFDYIFNGQERALKKCDPNIIVILASKTPELARRYAHELDQEIKYKNSGYNITYDVRSTNSKIKNKISLINKIKTRWMIKNNTKVSTVLQEKKSVPWYATLPVVGVLAFVGFGSIGIADNSGTVGKSSYENSYSDSVTPGGFSDEENEKNVNEIGTTQSNIYFSTTTVSATTTSKSTQTTLATPSIQETTTTVASGGETGKPQKEDNKTKEDKNLNDDKNSTKNVVINIGDKISVEEGLKYTADCLGGGTSNTIGSVSWRPATDYSIDNVAYFYNGQFLGLSGRNTASINDELNQYADKCGVTANEISTVALISLVPGAGDTGWAQINLNELQQSKVGSNVNVTNNISRNKLNYNIER